MVILKVIKIFLVKDIFDKFQGVIDESYIKNNFRELFKVWLSLIELMTEAQSDKTVDDLVLSYYTKYPSDISDLTKEVFNALQTTQVDPGQVLKYLEAFSQYKLAQKVSETAVRVMEGYSDFSELTELISDHSLPTVETEFITDNLEELYEQTYKKQGLRWRLETLNKSLGSLRTGDFGFVFARPETGKTTFLASEVTYMATQTDLPILWFNNEEQGNKVKVRCFQASLGFDTVSLFSKREENQERYKSLVGNRIRIYDSANIHRRDVERICKELRPALIVFDQIDKIKGFDEDRQDLELGAIYIWARELAKEYCPVIGVCQAGASAEGKKYLTMDDVVNAKCLDPKTKVLMYNGSWKEVENISVGEKVMGVDSTPRNVIGVACGEEEMFSIQHKIGGDTYVVNKSHILSLIDQKGNYIDKNILEYKEQDFGYRVKHELPEQNFPINPYFLGVWLGDGGKDKAEITTIDSEIVQTVKDECINWGCSYVQHLEKGYIIHARMRYHQGIKHPFLNKLKEFSLYKNKHIPDQYFKGSIEQRLALIAGLLDTDGTKVIRKHEYYVFSNANYLLASGLKKLALSCGLMATFKQKGKYYYVAISGNDLSIIPCKIARKKSIYKGYKDILKSRLIITPIGIGKYAGICIDGDHKFLIEGNIVTHNTSKQAEADWILGIGKEYGAGMEDVRGLHLSKNKLQGDEDTIPELRHAKMDVMIEPELARYKDVMRFQ